MEATLLCIDNSEWTRSGDFSPTRYGAQIDVVNLLTMSKIEANAENAVGIMTMAGKTPKVLITLTPNLGKILNSMTLIEYENKCNVAATLKIAQLALKHRQNKNQQQRIVLFIGSPIAEEKEQLVKIGKQLKKVNVAVDVISFGEDVLNEEKLGAFIEAVNTQDNSHLFTVPPGTILSEALFGTSLFQRGGGGDFVGGAPDIDGNQNNFPGDVNPELDPELALALRMSIEEEKLRQEAAAKAQQEANQGGEGSTQAGNVGGATDMELDDDAAVQEALQISMQYNKETPDAGTTDAMMDEEDELELALKMSMNDTSEPPAASSSTPQTDTQNQDYLKVLSGLPGVNPENALKHFNEKQKEEKQKESKEEQDKKGDQK
eukprot:TRINITY_DN1180_c0_g2_i1.p1 TRINITY_DN1180_c0_g2~~TRINITY_DN1180_c0_g2_i1.p1  ORF type:complete len:393 (-),score=86.34 TRINITY_DN1180_c0_g2_i1:187-1314(-)